MDYRDYRGVIYRELSQHYSLLEVPLESPRNAHISLKLGPPNIREVPSGMSV